MKSNPGKRLLGDIRIQLLVVLTVLFPAEKSYKVVYEEFYNGEKLPDPVEIIYQYPIVYLSSPEEKIQSFIDIEAKQNISTVFTDNKSYKLVIPHEDLPDKTISDETEKLMGYACSRADYDYFSNKIEVWFTEETSVKGSPYSRFLPNSGALVLKIRINNNHTLAATAIEPVDDPAPDQFNAEIAQEVTKAQFEEFKINSRFTRFPVFDNELVNYDANAVPADLSVDDFNRVYHFSKGTIILRKLEKTAEMSSAGEIYASLRCRSNGDAYDRTGSVFVIRDTKKTSILDAMSGGIEVLPDFIDNEGKTYQGVFATDQYEPPIEILRFFTSFGIGYFNDKREINNYNWNRDAEYKVDVTPLIPTQDDSFIIGVFIGNYDKGGHIVSLDLDLYPAFEEHPEPEKMIQPLFSTVNILEMSGQNYGRLFRNDTLRVEFEIKQNVENVKLLFTTTGHGGWGNGDEFNQRLNQIFLDDTEIFSILPWRTDCGAYRMDNPASGNFSNGLSSSDLSRSNWCPASFTPPYVIPLTGIATGHHQMEIVIQQGDDEGGSFNSWQVSGTLTGDITDFLKDEPEETR